MAAAESPAATRASYDAVAAGYHRMALDELPTRPVERSVLGLFASVVSGPVMDVGCGTGVTGAHLVSLGVDVVAGLDLSPGMLAIARTMLPSVGLTRGTMLTLPVRSGSLGGLYAYYSTIHVTDEQLPGVFAEFERVLAPGGHLLLGFQVGDVPRHMTSALGHDIQLVFHRRRPERVAELLADAGVPVRVRTVREALDGELTPHAFLLARKPA